MTTPRFRRNPRIASRTLEGRACLMHPAASELTVLNESGTLLWDALRAPRTEGELADAFLEAYETDGETAARDVREFLGRLAALDLLREEGS